MTDTRVVLRKNIRVPLLKPIAMLVYLVHLFRESHLKNQIRNLSLIPDEFSCNIALFNPTFTQLVDEPQ